MLHSVRESLEYLPLPQKSLGGQASLMVHNERPLRLVGAVPAHLKFHIERVEVLWAGYSNKTYIQP